MDFSSHNFMDAQSWLKQIDIHNLKKDFREQGYGIVKNLINEPALLNIYQDAVTKMHSGEVDVNNWRHDLGSHQDQFIKGVENTGQIMWPSDRIDGLVKGPLHVRSLQLSKALLGEDIEFDFDMLIYKDPFTGGSRENGKVNCFPGQQGETPWHQDESYWPSGMIEIEDKSEAKNKHTLLTSSPSPPLFSGIDFFHNSCPSLSKILMISTLLFAGPVTFNIPKLFSPTNVSFKLYIL